MSSSSAPMRSFGPGRSCRIATGLPTRPAASRTHCAVSSCCSCEPWLKFSRATSIPASTIRTSVSRSREAGPMVATIFVLRSTSCSLRSALPASRAPAVVVLVVDRLEHEAACPADHDLAGHVTGAGEPELPEFLAHEVGGELAGHLGAGPIGERGDRDDPAIAGVDHLVAEEALLIGEHVGQADIHLVHEVVHGTGGHPVLPDGGEHAVPLSIPGSSSRVGASLHLQRHHKMGSDAGDLELPG